VPVPDGLRGTEAAAAARRARADVKRAMDFSGASLRAAVEAAAGPAGAAIGRMRVVELLAAMPGVGSRRAQELAGLAGIAPGRRLAGLGSRQLDALAALIDERAARRARRPPTEAAAPLPQEGR
jgi:hypothetical protein